MFLLPYRCRQSGTRALACAFRKSVGRLSCLIALLLALPAFPCRAQTLRIAAASDLQLIEGRKRRRCGAFARDMEKQAEQAEERSSTTAVPLICERHRLKPVFPTGGSDRGEGTCLRQTRRIMTSVDLTRAAARSPGLRRISFAASAVMMEVMCCSPIARVIWASKPLYFTAMTRPMS